MEHITTRKEPKMWVKGLHGKKDVDSLLNDIHNLVDEDSDYEFDSGEAIEF